MREQILQRLKQLEAEFEEGQKMLAELETRQINLQNTILRISGAIQVLEELLAQSNAGVNEASRTPEAGQNIPKS